MARYLGGVLGPRLGLPRAGLQIDVPRHGLNSQLIIVRGESIAPRVVRFHRNPVEARACLRAHQLAEKHGLPVPRLVHHDLTLPHRLRHGFSVLVEEYLVGAHLDPGSLGEARLRALATTLGELHGVTQDDSRNPLSQNGRDFFRSVIRVKLLNRIDSLMGLPDEFPPPDQERMRRFVERMMQKWSNPPKLTLTHDKINRGNIVFTGDDRAYLIDLVTLRYGSPGKDLIATLYYFCESAEEEEIFKRLYFDQLDPAYRLHFGEFEPLYRVWHHLGRWASKSRAYAKRVEKKGPIEPSRIYSSRFAERDAVWAWVAKTEI